MQISKKRWYSRLRKDKTLLQFRNIKNERHGKKEMINVKVRHWGPCLGEMQLDDHKIDLIKGICFKNKKNDFRHSLAGHLDHEYSIDHFKLQQILQNNINAYENTLRQFMGNNEVRKLKIKSAWVNYMHAGDYNPPHIHEKCEFSAVVYIDVPNEIKKEYDESVCSGLGPGEITFFLNVPMKNFITNYQIFPKKGNLFIFPDTLIHAVSPFKAKVERVSVAFNLIWY